MKQICVVLTACFLTIGSGLVLASEPAGENQPKLKHPAFAEVEDDSNLPRVLLIGDSISIGYTVPVRIMLRGVANVHRIPENGGPTSRGVEKIEAWLGDKPWDVIHFNWGLHDLKIMEDGKHQVALKQYKKNFHKLVTRLTKTGARLIWCSTTPVPQVPVEKMRPPRRWKDVIRYNFAAKEIADKYKIPINDLYAFALPRLDKIQRKNNVHFTKEGSKILAAQVVQEIKKVLMH